MPYGEVRFVIKDGTRIALLAFILIAHEFYAQPGSHKEVDGEAAFLFCVLYHNIQNISREHVVRWLTRSIKFL